MAIDTMAVASTLASLNSTNMSVHEVNDDSEKEVKTMYRVFFIPLLGKAKLKDKDIEIKTYEGCVKMSYSTVSVSLYNIHGGQVCNHEGAGQTGNRLMSGLADAPVKVKSNTCLWVVPDAIIRHTSSSKYKLIDYILPKVQSKRKYYKFAHRVHLLLSFFKLRLS